MSDLNSALRAQHEDIIKNLGRLRSAWDDRNGKLCKEAAFELLGMVKDHHQAEYKNLFSKLFGNPMIQTGGPFCMYFFDFFMTDRPFSKALRRINQVRPQDQKLTEIPIPKGLKHFFREKSMLSIPIEEHLSQEALLGEIQNVLENWPALDPQWMSHALEDLADLTKSNIEKEETCLWAIAKNLEAAS